MNVYLNITIATISGAAGSGLIYLLFKTYFTEKIKASIKGEYDSKLENLKGDINKNHTIIDRVLLSQTQVFQEGQKERIEAIKILWSNYISIRNSLIEINSIDEILLESEFNTLYTKDWIGNDLVDKTLQALTIEKRIDLEKQKKHIETVRPFLNEQIWMNIVSLRGFSGRLIYLYNKGCVEKKIQHWKNDSALLKLAKDALTKEEFEYISNAKIASVKIFQNFIEQKLLTEINKITIGQMAADNTYNRALHLIELTKIESSAATNK